MEKEGKESPKEGGDSDSSSTTTEVVSDLSDSEDWMSSYSNDLVDIRSPHFKPDLALRLSEDESCKVISPLPPSSTVPKYLNLVTYAKAVPSPSKSPDLSLQLKPRGLSKNAEIPSATLVPPPLSAVAASSSTSTSGILTSTPQSGSQPSTSSKPQFPIPGRRFLAHQLPVYAPRVQPPDTVKVMATVEGPLGALRVAMEAKKRVKVWTRRDTGIRGYLTGFIEAFDKHWNLALRDVDECFSRKRRPKSIVESGDQSGQGSVIKTYQTHEDFPTPAPSSESGSTISSRGSRSKSRDNNLQPPSPRTPTKKSKRIAARSRSSNRREILKADCSEDLVNWCRLKMKNLSLKDTPKKAKTKPSSISSSATLVQPIKSKSHEKKHGLTSFTHPWKDANGFVVVGVTEKVEIVERHVGQLFVMGNDVVMVETMR